ncbi:MAG: nuclear transport factor 2 family protein [Proteobacteria bacterium]|nr:nuclear transport factor 2 family protein [Pseudomonadota bacterium]MDA0992034.1 nuclear transport factor 2 family protein [Pseudomonadota bacterium]
MNMRGLLFLMLLMPFLATADDADAIGVVIDDFHDAAAHGDKDRYLGHMTDDGVFMGTDEWERWPKQAEFAEYVSGRFKNGAGWKYRSVERQIRIADSGETAWFDEVLYSEQNGRFRGTGVLSKIDGNWKIAHYAMSFLVLNENWTDVIELTKKTRALEVKSDVTE